MRNSFLSLNQRIPWCFAVQWCLSHVCFFDCLLFSGCLAVPLDLFCVTIAGEGLHNLGLCSTLTTSEQVGIFTESQVL